MVIIVHNSLQLRYACCSHLFLNCSFQLSKSTVFLAGGPKNLTISGPNSVQVGVKATFECSAVCTPACVYTWDVYGRTLHGSTIDFTISRYVATETLTCTAQNVVTGKRAAMNETLDVTGNMAIFVYNKTTL